MYAARTALVLGATGGIGGAAAEALLAHGWKVRGLVRDPIRAADGGRDLTSRIEWTGGDAMDRDDVVRAARGVQVIVHAVNPPGYRNWETVVLPMIDNTIAAARAAGGARIVLPGTIYNFDPATTPVLRDTSLQEPRSRKGLIRRELEARLERAATGGEAPALVLRAGDFFGPHARSSWFSQAMIKPGRPVRSIVVMNSGIGHAWAYLPDLAETFARLLDMPERLRSFERLQFEGFWDADGTGMPAALAAAIGRDRIATRAFPWWLMRLAAPFGGFPREAVDVMSTWRHPVRLDNRRVVELLELEPRTPVVEALRSTLGGLGCLPEAADPVPAGS